jgi:rod shape-determining protein MreC
MYRKQVRRRRAVLVLLVVVSLILLSSRFSEGSGGPLHSVQRGIATVLSPFEEVAGRALKPGRDAINWFGETFKARGENADLRAQVRSLRSKLVRQQQALGENRQFRKLLKLGPGGGEAGYEAVTGRVIARSPSVWYSTVSVDKGSSSQVAVDDPVITGDGLIGHVTDVTSGSAQVTLITDQSSAVSVQVLPNGPQGVLKPNVGDPNDLLLDFIENDRKVRDGQLIVTAGWRLGKLGSMYPYGIKVGRVTQASASEQETYQRVHVKPFADVRDLQFVRILTKGTASPGQSQAASPSGASG